MRVIFMGTPEFALPSLEALRARGEQLVAVVTQPDRPQGRGQRVSAPPVKVAALAAGVPVQQPAKVRQPEFLEWCRTAAPDLIVVVAFGQILPKTLLDIPRLGCINVHASLLPKYRGAAPIAWAIIRGETETGITTMQMDPGMDTGPMLLQRAMAIRPEDTTATLGARLAALGARTLNETLDLLAAGRLSPTVQDSSRATLAPMLKKDDGRIDWRQPAAAIHALVRGMDPWPGAWTTHAGEPWRIWNATVESGTGEPGMVLRADAAGIAVGTRDGHLVITELQTPGKRRLVIRDYLTGHAITTGVQLG
ncbi:MAG: methionyl-tRNA formyltransferase [Nitrospirota bacterium]